MSILPPGIRMYFDPELSMPLGPALPREVNRHPFDDLSAAWKFANIEHDVNITEADCRQVKGAKKPASIKNLEQAVFEDWLARTCPSGDVEQVQRLWEESTEYEEFCAEHNPAPPSTERPPKFKVGDLVRPTYNSTWGNGRVTKTEFDTHRKCQVTYYVPEHSPYETFDEDSDLELVPPSEPKEADGWVAMHEDMPDLPPNQYAVRLGRDEGYSRRCSLRNGWNRSASELGADGWQYRLVKQQ